MKFSAKTLPWLALLAIVAFSGCEEDKEEGGVSTPSTIEGYIQAGWEYYAMDNYSGAYNAFQTGITIAQEALNPFSVAAYAELYAFGHDTTFYSPDSFLFPDSTHLYDFFAAVDEVEEYAFWIKQAVSGIGWTTIKDVEPALGVQGFNEALGVDISITYLDSSLYPWDPATTPPEYANGTFYPSAFIDTIAFNLDDLVAEIYGGYAILLQTMQQWQQSNEKISYMLDSLGYNDWHFNHDGGTNHLDLRLIRAENYYNLADFEASLNQVDELLALTEIVTLWNQNSGAPLFLGPVPDVTQFNLATPAGRGDLISVIEDLDKIL